MAKQPLLSSNSTCNTVGSHPPDSRTDSCTESWSCNSPIPITSPTLSPLYLRSFHCKNLSTHERFSCHLCAHTLGHKYCKVVRSAPSNSFQAFPSSWSAETRMLNTLFTDSLAARVLQADTPMQDLKGRGKQEEAVAICWEDRTSGKTVVGAFDSLKRLWQRF